MKPLARALSRQIGPLSLLTALLVGGVLPAIWHSSNLTARQSEARTWARHLAAQIEPLAHRRPQLWPYETAQLLDAVDVAARAPLGAQIRVDTARDPAVFEAGAAPESPVEAWAGIEDGGRVVGRLLVRLEGADLMASARRIFLGAGLLGVLLGLALFNLPVRAIRRADAENLRLWRALSEAKAGLEVRVEERTAQLRRREQDLQRLGARLLQVQEEERARISRDLHDDLGQILTGLRLRLAALDGLVEPAGAPHLEAASEAVDAGVEQVRRIAHDMRPPELDGLGLADALGSHARRWAEVVGLELDLDLSPEEPPAHISEVLFRVAQEALTNIARHAEAARAQLIVDRFDDGWRLIVEDDGRGFTPKGEGRQGLGLLGAAERAEGAGGYLDRERAELGGARILVWLPDE